MTASARAAARPVVITGGASGMGRATADVLAAAGHPVGLVDRDGDALGSAAAELRSTGASVAVATADVADEEQVDAAFAVLREQLGPCWGLAAAAGVLGPATAVLDTTPGFLREQLEVNVIGVHNCVRAALRDMLSRTPRDGGRVVAWSSDAAEGGCPQFSAYALAKAGVISLCKAVAAEHGSDGIAANAILPGPVATPMAAYLTEEQVAASARTVPLGRWVEPGEVAAAVAHLMTDAGGAINGIELPVDGGRLAARGRI